MTTSPPPNPSVFVRIARWCMTHRWQTIGAWLLAAVAATFVGQAVGTRDISSFRLAGTESQAAYDLLAAHAPEVNGGTDQLVYVARPGSSLRDPATRARVRASIERVGRDPVVTSVSDPLAEGGQLTPDGRIGVATITYKGVFEAIKPTAFKRVQEAAFAGRSAQLRIEHGGLGAQTVQFTEQSSTEFLGFLVAAIILLFFFGSAIAAGVPLLTAILAIGTTLGLIPVISHLVDTPEFASQLAGLIGIAVGIDYALIVVTRYRAERGRGVDRDAALELAMDTAGRTVFFAAGTVIIALLGLLLLGLSFLHGAAVASALAVLLTMIGALTVLPAILSKSGDWIDRLRLPLPGRDAARRRGLRAGERDVGALVGVRAAPPVARRRRGGADPAGARAARAAHAPRHLRRGRRPAGHDDALRLRPDRRGLRPRRQRLLPARHAAAARR